MNNLRASKTVNGTKTTFVWNGQNLASETKSGTTTAYTYDPTGIISSKTGSAALVRFIKDPHGNVVATSQNNSVFGTYDYTAFGKQIEATNTTNPFRYCGEYYDNESGLTYLRNRYYNSTTGRFISEDPIRDGANWYVYGNNNPIAFVDPWGLRYYILYGNDQQKASEDTKKQLEELYPDQTICSIQINSANEFYEMWDSMGFDEDGNKISIDGVFIHLHGSPDYIHAGNEKVYASQLSKKL